MKNFLHKLHINILYFLKYKKIYEKQSGVKPHAVHIDTRSKRIVEKEQEEFNQFLEFATLAITPNRKEDNELIEYIKSKYGAAEFEIDPKEYRIDLFNFLKNEYSSIFEDPLLKDFTFVDLITDSNYRSIESQTRVDYLFERIELLNFEFKFYRFMNNPDSLTEEHKFFKVGIEKNSGKLLMSGHSDNSMIIAEDISLYYGVTANDIEKRTNTFIAYAIYLRDKGLLKH